MPRRRHSSERSDEEEGRASHKKGRTKVAVEDIEDRLESLISRLGEKSTSSLESNVEGLAIVLEKDMDSYRSKILKILCQCVVVMPEKQSIYCTLVGLLNAKNHEAGGEFVDTLTRQLKEYLKDNDYHLAKHCVRFLADLVNCHVVTLNSLFMLLDTFVEVCLEENIPQVRSDWYVFAALSSLPWVGRELYDRKGPELQRMLSTIEGYLLKRIKTHVPALRVWTSDIPHPQEEYLDCLWAQIQNVHRNEWAENQIPRPYVAFEKELSDALQHAIPPLMPPAHESDSTYPLPRVVFRMFDYLDVPEGPVLPGVHAVERFILEERFNSIIDFNYRDRKVCAALLLNFDTKTKIPLNYMIVEVVFGRLFALPAPTHLEIFYGSLLIELCKLQPGSMPQVLAQATEILYERLDTMHASCIDRFVNWFSYHLSNFQFRWSWEDWSDCLKGDPLSPKAVFVRECLLKCMRLSYHQRVSEIVPPDFGDLIPVEPKPIFKFMEDGPGAHSGTKVAHILLSAIKSKCTPVEAVEILRTCPGVTSDSMDTDAHFNPLKVEVFTQTLLYLGAKSFTHSFAAIAKFHTVFKGLAEAEEAQIVLLNAIYELWRNHQQMLVVLVDKLLKTQIVECSAVANWIFSQDMTHEFSSFYIWEILHSTISKMNKHVSQLSKEVEEAKDKFDAAQRRGCVSFDDDVPTEEQIERMEERLEAAKSDQKNLFLIIFQRFIIILSDHFGHCESERIDYNTPMYKWMIDRLQQVFVLYNEYVHGYINTLEGLMFTNDIDNHILQVFQQFCALRS